MREVNKEKMDGRNGNGLGGGGWRLIGIQSGWVRIEIEDGRSGMGWVLTDMVGALVCLIGFMFAWEWH